MGKPEVILQVGSEDVEMAEMVGSLLRERYGVFQLGTVAAGAEIGLEIAQEEPAAPVLSIGSGTVTFPNGEVVSVRDEAFGRSLSGFALSHLTMTAEQKSIRSDRCLLEEYRHPTGGIDVLQDPRRWINGNAFIAELQQTRPEYGSLVDYVTDQGLFIKPAAYKNERNYWNAPTNGGLPVVRKRDEVHEGTFMLHDLFHFAIADPIPFSMDGGQDNYDRSVYLHHRMASEATTLVLTDMMAVHAAGLQDQGYDVNKRKIYPLFESIRKNLGAEDDATISRLLIRANIAFALTGDTHDFEDLGADPIALRDYEDKYDVFFSADYDWNKSNWSRMAAEAAANPDIAKYVRVAKHVFGQSVVSTVVDMYPRGGSLAAITRSFTDQVDRALAYQRRDEDAPRMRRSAQRYLAGQYIAFNRFADAPGAKESEREFLTHGTDLIHNTVLMSDDDAQAAIRTHFDAALDVYAGHIDRCASAGLIDPQEASLYKLHAPLYPPLFINYEKQAGQYKNLREKMMAERTDN